MKVEIERALLLEVSFDMTKRQNGKLGTRTVVVVTVSEVPFSGGPMFLPI